MFVKLKVIVICAVLLNFGECNNCDDILKCVTNWKGDAKSPESNVTLDYIEDISANISTSHKSPDNNDNLLTKLSRFLVEQFSSLTKEVPSFKTIGEKTKIYVQSFKINESVSENKSTVKIINPDVIENNYDNTVSQIDNIINFENATLLSYENNNFNRNLTLTTQRTMKISTTESDLTEKNSSDITHHANFENNTYNSNNINEKETVTTSEYVNTVSIQETNENVETTTENSSGVPAKTTKGMENNNSDKKIQAEINNITPRVHTDEINEISDKINIKDNYIDNTNDLFYGTNDIDIAEIVHDNLTDYLDIDYVDMYKDTTNEDVEYTPAVYIPTTTAATKIITDKKPTDGVDSVYPWIATVFVMNPESKQFEYICDGSLLSERVVLTGSNPKDVILAHRFFLCTYSERKLQMAREADYGNGLKLEFYRAVTPAAASARCVLKNNVTVDAANILIILGKRSLQSTGPNEKVLRVKSIKIHNNFVSTEGKVDNDLAIAVLAEAAMFNVDTQPAPLGTEDKSAPLATATTGWHVSGPLQPLYLEQSTENSRMDVNCDDYFCAILGDSETTCPSYGGLFVERQDDQWRLKGIASGSPMNSGVCFNKHLTFTKIGNYLDWIKKNMQETSSE